VKICGITTMEAASAAIEAGADALGFVVAPGSPRRLDVDAIEPLRAVVPPFVDSVVVLRNQDPKILEGLRPFDNVQLHGDESEQEVSLFGAPVIRGFGFAEDQVRRWDQCDDVAALLVDGPAGGTGQAFDHDALAAVRSTIGKPLILAGGLTAGNVGRAIRTLRPFAVDVSSGVESSPGIKDPALIEAFCAAVREADSRR
jgi:phosphoribosylanthranilate isomerase